MTDAASKHTALVAKLTAVLQALDSRYKIVGEPSNAARYGYAGYDEKQMLTDGVLLYCTVLHFYPEDPNAVGATRNIEQVSDQVGHRFLIELWHEASSRPDYDFWRIWKGEGGVMQTLQSLRDLVAGGRGLLASDPEGEQFFGPNWFGEPERGIQYHKGQVQIVLT